MEDLDDVETLRITLLERLSAIVDRDIGGFSHVGHSYDPSTEHVAAVRRADRAADRYFAAVLAQIAHVPLRHKRSL